MLLALSAVRPLPFPLNVDPVILPPVVILPCMLRFCPEILPDDFIAPVVFRLP